MILLERIVTHKNTPQLFPGAFFGGRSGRGSGAKNMQLSRPPSSSRRTAVLIMYAYHLGEKASRRTTCIDTSVAQGSKAKFGECGFFYQRR